MSRAQKIDVAMAAGLLVLGIAEAIARDAAIGWFVSAVVNAAAVCFRRRQPVVALLAVIVVRDVRRGGVPLRGAARRDVGLPAEGLAA